MPEPTMVEVRARIGSGWSWSKPYRDEMVHQFDRALAAHDAELREQIATEIEAASASTVASGDWLRGMTHAAKLARGKE